MADKAIGELLEATTITQTDLFVLEQNNTAKKLSGQTLINDLTKMLDGHGGIQSITKKSTSGLNDTYTITFADASTYDFVVSNGAKGDKGDNSYVWIKFSSVEPTSNADMYDTPDNWMGIYSGNRDTAPTSYTSYKWFEIKGEKGNTGKPAVLGSSSVMYQVSTSGTVIPDGNWYEGVPAVQPGNYLWTRTTIQFNTGNPIVSYSVSRYGIDGTGAVSTVNNKSPDENGNVTLTAADVGALPETYTPPSPPVTSVNGKTGAVQLAASDVGALANAAGAVKTANLSDGAATRAKLAGDALYSPVRKYTATSYDIIADDLGKTLADGFSLRNNNITLTMSKALMDAAPVGAEIAFARTYNMKSIKLTTTGARIINIDAGQIGGASATVMLSLPERGSMFALKKIEQDNTYGSFWILTGNVEVEA